MVFYTEWSTLMICYAEHFNFEQTIYNYGLIRVQYQHLKTYQNIPVLLSKSKRNTQMSTKQLTKEGNVSGGSGFY